MVNVISYKSLKLQIGSFKIQLNISDFCKKKKIYFMTFLNYINSTGNGRIEF